MASSLFQVWRVGLASPIPCSGFLMLGLIPKLPVPFQGINCTLPPPPPNYLVKINAVEPLLKDILEIRTPLY